MPLTLWGIHFTWQVLLLLIAAVSIQQSASYPQTNFALYQEVSVSSNNTCGLQGKDEFCAAVDQHLRCRQPDFCSSRCSFAETTPRSVDLVATGTFDGEVTYLNIRGYCVSRFGVYV